MGKGACFLLGICGLLFSICIAAQEPADNSNMLHALLTEIAAQNNEEQNTEQLVEMLEDLAENPVYINDADREELGRINWLTDFQIKSLLDHVKKNGAILSPYEIAYLHGFTPQLAQTLTPFIVLEKRPDVDALRLKQMFRYGKHRVITGATRVLADQEGYLRPDSVTNRYTGSPLRLHQRYAFSYANRLHFGVTASKNAGEPFFHESNRCGFDFYSAHFQFNTKGWLKTVTAGDYRADFGQGLVLWSGINFGKNAMTHNAMRYNSGLRKYGSPGRDRFMRGAGVTFRLRPADVSVFYSRKAIDAVVTASNEGGKALQVSSFPAGGYHRTPAEIDGERAVVEEIVGANVSVDRADVHVGVTAVYYGYDAAVVPNVHIYNHFAFTGRRNGNYSVDFRARVGDAVFYGEQAIAQNGADAMLLGTQILVGERLTANLFYRHYARDYHAHHGMAVGENSRNNNEEGFFAGWNLRTGGRWQFSWYCDIFRFPWLRFRADAPSFGRDAMIQADFIPSRDTKMYVQARYREREENVAETVVSNIAPVKMASAKLVFSHQITEGCGIGNHLEIKRRQQENAAGMGYFIAQDVYATINTFGKHPLRISLRYALFDTNDYYSRIYSYESDMPYSFSVPAFYDQGTRLYVLLKYTMNGHLNLYFKYAATQYSNKAECGSGLNMIHGNRYPEAKLLAVCTF